MRRKKRSWLVAVLILAAFIGGYSSMSKANFSPDIEENPQLNFTKEISAEGAIIIEDKPSKIIYQKNIHQKMFPASTTKILTLLVALESGKLSNTVTVPQDLNEHVPKGSTSANLKPGDKLTLEQLLYGMMLPSGNDSAYVIAQYLGGSEENFTKILNKKAKKLGAEDSNFVNPHGFHDPEHYTTPYDFALICQAALKYPQFFEVIGAKSYKATYQNQAGKTVVQEWKNSDKFCTEYDLEGFLGGKTGFTTPAGHTLVTFSQYKKHNYITVIFKDGATDRYTNTKDLLAIAYEKRDEINQKK